MGRNGDSAWSIGPRGVTRVDRTDRPWPVWIESPRYGLVVDRAEMLETGLLPDWNWKREEAVQTEPGVERLVATRTKGRSGEPNSIDVQIDTLTGRVKRMEIKWPEGGMPRMPRDGMDMRGDGDGDHGVDEARSEDRHVDAGSLQQLGHGLGDLLVLVVERTCATNPVEVFGFERA